MSKRITPELERAITILCDSIECAGDPQYSKVFIARNCGRLRAALASAPDVAEFPEGWMAKFEGAHKAQVDACKEVKEELAGFHDFALTLFPDSPGEFAGHSIIDTVKQLVERNIAQLAALQGAGERRE